MANFYCLFEQSGTFKNAFIELGHKAFDFDIENEYGEQHTTYGKERSEITSSYTHNFIKTFIL